MSRPPRSDPGTPAHRAARTARAPGGPVSDLRGGARLAVAGARQIAGVAEALHGQIQRLALPLGGGRQRGAAGAGSEGLPPARGISGWVYRGVQGGMALVGSGLEGLLAPFDGALADDQPTPRRDRVVAALNGVLGDHLLRSGNPLAIPMQLRRDGRPLDPAALPAGTPGAVLLLVHGLCMSDLGWARNGHDHGQALAAALGLAPVYAFYNSGLHVSDNGRALADALEALVQDWPVPVTRLVIVGHSMGGLVARSAVAQAREAGQGWPDRLRQLVFLGTPHHGAPLERAGNWLHRVLDLSPYAAPFGRLSRIRSAGITDLRHGNLLAGDWAPVDRFDHRDHRTPVPLPPGVDCYAVASTIGGPDTPGSLLGDGLVTVDSALGRHRRPAMDLGLPADHCWIGPGIHHLDLLSDPAVYRRLLYWLGP